MDNQTEEIEFNKITILTLEMITEKHNKFYTGYFNHGASCFHFRYGKIGAVGSYTDPKRFPDIDTAYNAFMKQLKSKTAKGYETVDSFTLMTTVKEPTNSELYSIETFPHYVQRSQSEPVKVISYHGGVVKAGDVERKIK